MTSKRWHRGDFQSDSEGRTQRDPVSRSGDEVAEWDQVWGRRADACPSSLVVEEDIGESEQSRML